MTRIAIKASLLAATLVLATPAARATVIFSDNFDDGDVSDWTLSNSPNITAPVLTVDTAFFTSPGYSLFTYFDAPGGGTGEGTVRATRSFTAPVAGDYTLDLTAMSMECSGCVVSYDVLVDDISLTRTNEEVDLEARSFLLSGLGAGSHSITLGMYTTGAMSGRFLARFDDVVISTDAELPVGTPEPATAAILGAGLLGLAGLRRRRG
jgi:hypothetical protein